MICPLAARAGNVELAAVQSCSEELTVLQVATVGAKTYTRVLRALAEALSPSSTSLSLMNLLDVILTASRGEDLVWREADGILQRFVAFHLISAPALQHFLYNQSSTTQITFSEAEVSLYWGKQM